MGYKESLEAAGANVLQFETFGSYQGDWWAKVVYNGQTGWIYGSYGSCSGCDAFEAEVGYLDRPIERDGKYYADNWHMGNEIPKEDYDHLLQEVNKKLANFGHPYLNDMLTQEEAEAKASENIEWDMDAEAAVKFIRENAIQ